MNLLGGRARTKLPPPADAPGAGYPLRPRTGRRARPAALDLLLRRSARGPRAYAGTYLQQEIVAGGRDPQRAGLQPVSEGGRAVQRHGRQLHQLANDAQVPRTTVYEYFEILRTRCSSTRCPPGPRHARASPWSRPSTTSSTSGWSGAPGPAGQARHAGVRCALRDLPAARARLPPRLRGGRADHALALDVRLRSGLRPRRPHRGGGQGQGATSSAQELRSLVPSPRRRSSSATSASAWSHGAASSPGSRSCPRGSSSTRSGRASTER